LKPTNNTNGGFSFPGFGNPATPATGFQFSTPAATSTATTTTTANTSSTFSFGSSATSPTQPLFGNAPKINFSDLAKQSSSTNNDKPTSNGTEQRGTDMTLKFFISCVCFSLVFAGQGSLIFGTNAANIPTTTHTNEDDDGGEGGGDDDSYEPNVSFKPIVQLSAVEVKTGEEDENVLFCERGKLYRFDSEANQMKERGTGEIKILQHKTTNLCRILMRREQVLKLCANHQITSQMELKPHQGSENAYVWSAMDFADGEPKHETLCIRFKSSDTAKKFVKQFNEAKQGNTDVQQ
jgi:Ran-binding protein 1